MWEKRGRKQSDNDLIAHRNTKPRLSSAASKGAGVPLCDAAWLVCWWWNYTDHVNETSEAKVILLPVNSRWRIDCYAPVLIGRLRRYLDDCMCNNYNEHLFCPNLASANREVYLSIDLSIYISRAFLVITTRGRHLPINSSNNSLNVAEILDLPSSCHNFGDTICVIVFFFQINNAYLSFYFSEYVILVVSIIFLLLQKYAEKTDITNWHWVNWSG